MSRKTKAVLLITGTVLLGFLREYLFANINWIYLTLVNGRMNGAQDEFHFLLQWTPAEIIQLKWILTAVFILLFYLFSHWTINTMFKKKLYNKIVLLVYLGLLIIAGILFIIGKSTGIYDTIYGPIRTVIGMTQSFTPLIILIIAFKFFPETK